MKFRKQKKLICFLTALLLLVYGACFDFNQACSVFACENTPLSANNRFLAFQNTHPAREIGTPEAPVERVTSNARRQMERSGQQTVLRSSFDLVTDGSNAPSLKPVFRMISEGLHHEARSNTVIVRYIHTKDGRKPSVI